ncbi:MAG: hypothetical protein ABGU93_00400 [Acetobacterium sp.]|uniref:hypothetical protein n=1 Tax=Acetobacterium sp. TaxID=1872094 RepID=UPI003242498A
MEKIGGVVVADNRGQGRKFNIAIPAKKEVSVLVLNTYLKSLQKFPALLFVNIFQYGITRKFHDAKALNKVFFKLCQFLHV